MNSYIFRRVREALEAIGVTVEPFERETDERVRETLGLDGVNEPIWMVTRRRMGLGTPYRVMVGDDGRLVSVRELRDIFRTIGVEWGDFESAISAIA